MAWAKFEGAMCFHRKVVNAGNEAVGAWVRMVAFAVEHFTDGHLTKKEALSIAERPAILARLASAEVRLLEIDGDGYRVHDFGDYQPTGPAAAVAHEARKAKAKKAARARWDAPPTATFDAHEHATEHAVVDAPKHADPMLGPVLGRCPDPDPVSVRVGARVGDPRPLAPRPAPAPATEGAAVGEPLLLRAFIELWTNKLRKTPADRYKDNRDRWRDLCERIGADAALLSPPMTAEAYAEALMLALPAYAEHAARTSETVPSISVAAFEGWYATLAAWVARTRAKAPKTAAKAPEAERPPVTAEEEAEAADCRDRLFKRGKYAVDAEPAPTAEPEPFPWEVEPKHDEEMPTF